MTAAKSADVRWLLKDALGVVFKRKRLILGLFLIVALGISLAVLSVPTSYEVAGKLVVTRSRGDVLVTPGDQRSFNFALTAPTLQDMAVHAELLKNRSLIEAVVKKLGLDKKRENSQAKAAENPITAGLNQISVWVPWTSSSPAGTQKAAPEQNRMNGAVDSIAGGLTIQVLPNSNLLVVRYRSSDPSKGAEIVNTLLDLYRDRYLELRRNPGVVEFFVEQRDQLEQSLKASEAALTSFQKKTGLLSASVQVDAYARRLAEAENNVTDAQFDLREHEQRLKIFASLLETQPERVTLQETTKYNPMIQTMQERLLTLELDKQRLLTLYTDNDRRVQDKQQEIDAQKKRLADVQRQQWIPDTEVTQLNDRRRDMEEKVLSSRLSALKTKVRYEGAVAIASEMRMRVQELGLADVQKQALLREIQASSEAYLLYRKKAEEARITAAMDENKITNVAIGELASRGAPIGAPKNLSLLFAVMVGLVSGVGGAFLREFFDGSIKSEQEIRSFVDLPVLGSIPEEKTGKKNGNGHGKNGKHGVEG
jgi:polysaccharide biosynthesis transport protein